MIFTFVMKQTIRGIFHTNQLEVEKEIHNYIKFYC